MAISSIFRWHDVIEIVHATLGAEGDDLLQTFLAKLHRVSGSGFLPVAPLRKGTVAAGTTLEVDGFSFFQNPLWRGGFGGGYVYGETRQRDAYGYPRRTDRISFFIKAIPNQLLWQRKTRANDIFLAHSPEPITSYRKRKTSLTYIKESCLEGVINTFSLRIIDY